MSPPMQQMALARVKATFPDKTLHVIGDQTTLSALGQNSRRNNLRHDINCKQDLATSDTNMHETRLGR